MEPAVNKKNSLLPDMEVYAWVGDHEEGGKGMVALKNPDGSTVLLVSTERTYLEHYRPAIKQLASFGKEITLVKFAAAEVLEIVHCNTKH